LQHPETQRTRKHSGKYLPRNENRWAVLFLISQHCWLFSSPRLLML
jgi:hypothetical protein